MSQRKTRIAVFAPAKMSPVIRTLKQSIAASIGRTLTRHSYLDHVKTLTLARLLGISLKQCRVAIRLPESRRYVTIIEDLLTYLGLQTQLNFRTYGDQLIAADTARNNLAHSIYLLDEGQPYIQLVRGHWDHLPQDVKRVNRALQPETVLVDRAYLAKQRKTVEIAIRRAEKFDRLISGWLQALSEKRRTEPSADRRSRPHTGKATADQPQSPPG